MGVPPMYSQRICQIHLQVQLNGKAVVLLQKLLHQGCCSVGAGSEATPLCDIEERDTVPMAACVQAIYHCGGRVRVMDEEDE